MPHPGGRAFHQSSCQSLSSAREGDSGGFDSQVHNSLFAIFTCFVNVYHVMYVYVL